MEEQEKEGREPRRLTRIGGLVIIILSVLVMVLTISGIVGVWAVNEPLTTTILDVLKPLEEALSFAADLLERIGELVERARGVVDTIDAMAEALGANIEENRLILNLISKALGDELEPVVQTVAEVVDTVNTAATTLDNAVKVARALPFPYLDKYETEITRLEEASAEVLELTASLQDLETRADERRSETAEDIVSVVTTRTSKMHAILDEVQADVDYYDAQVGDLQERVGLLKARIPLWIDLAAIVITVLLLWLALSQVSVFIHGWSFFTGQDLLARWR